jgi:hypothetical protein
MHAYICLKFLKMIPHIQIYVKNHFHSSVISIHSYFIITQYTFAVFMVNIKLSSIYLIYLGDQSILAVKLSKK